MNFRPLLNLANCLTMFRFPAAPVMLWLILQFDASGRTPETAWVSLAVCGLAFLVFLSDFFDGRAARAYKSVTTFGKIMDPIADSTFFMTVLFAFAVSPRFHMPIWFGVLVLYREIAMQVFRRYAALRGKVLSAGASGKAKMFVQSLVMAGVGGLIAIHDQNLMSFHETTLVNIVFWCGFIVTAVNIISLVVYFRDLPALIREPIHADGDSE